MGTNQIRDKEENCIKSFVTIKPPRFREDNQLGFAVQTQIISNNLMYGHAPLKLPMSVADDSKKNKMSVAQPEKKKYLHNYQHNSFSVVFSVT